MFTSRVLQEAEETTTKFAEMKITKWQNDWVKEALREKKNS